MPWAELVLTPADSRLTRRFLLSSAPYGIIQIGKCSRRRLKRSATSAGTKIKSAFPHTKRVIGTLKDPCQEVRLEAIFSLIVVGVPGGPQVAPMIAAEQQYLEKLVSDTKQPERIQIWARIGIMRVTNDISESQLVGIAKHFKSRKVEARIHAARAIGAIGPKAKSRLNDLIEELDGEKDNEVLLWVIFAVGNMKSEGEPARKFLEKHRDDSDPIIKAAVEEALKKLEDRYIVEDDPKKKDMKKGKDRKSGNSGGFAEDRDK